MKSLIRSILTFIMIMTGASGYARANALPHCTSPREVVSGT